MNFELTIFNEIIKKRRWEYSYCILKVDLSSHKAETIEVISYFHFKTNYLC